MVANPTSGQLNMGKYMYSCPRSRLRTWSRDTGSAISTLWLYLVLTRGIRPTFHDHGVHIIRRQPPPGQFRVHQVTQLIAYRRSLLRVRRNRPSICPQCGSSNGCCLFNYHHGPVFVRLSFPIPTHSLINRVWLLILLVVVAAEQGKFAP